MDMHMKVTHAKDAHAKDAHAGDIHAQNAHAEGMPEYPAADLVAVVAKLAERYTCKESSSISYEKAQQLMDAALYCIRECGEAECILGEEAAQEAYELGYRIVLKKTARLRDIYHNLILDFDSYGNRCLEETVTRGLPAFLQWYDVRFCPQETVLTLDYPVLMDLSGVTGIDAVLLYGKCIAREQAFLHAFDRAWVVRCLGAYSGGGGDMIENLCSILLPDIIGHAVLKKPWQENGYSPEDYRRLAEGFSGCCGEELEEYLRRILWSLTGGIFSQDTREGRAAADYICGGIPDLATRIRHGAESDCLDQVFRR